MVHIERKRERILAEIWAAPPSPQFCLNVNLESGGENETKDKMRRTRVQQHLLVLKSWWKNKAVWQKRLLQAWKDLIEFTPRCYLTASQDAAFLVRVNHGGCRNPFSWSWASPPTTPPCHLLFTLQLLGHSSLNPPIFSTCRLSDGVRVVCGINIYHKM